MLAGATIYAADKAFVGKALSAHASLNAGTEIVMPDIRVNRTELLDFLHACAMELRSRYDDLHTVFDRECRRLVTGLKALGPAEMADPEGEGVEATEKGEAHFKARREALARLRDGLAGNGVPSGHDIFEALDRLDGLYGSIIAAMPEIRWMALVVEGVRTAPVGGRGFPSGAAFAEAFDEWLRPLSEGHGDGPKIH